MDIFARLKADFRRLKATRNRAEEACQAAEDAWELANPAPTIDERRALRDSCKAARLALAAEYTAFLAAGPTTPDEFDAIVTGQAAMALSLAQARMAVLAEEREARKVSYGAALWDLQRVAMASAAEVRRADYLLHAAYCGRNEEVTEALARDAVERLMERHAPVQAQTFHRDDRGFHAGCIFDGSDDRDDR